MIVNNNHVLQPGTRYNPEILYVEAIFGFEAVITMKKSLDYIDLVVYVLDDGLGILLGSRCEDIDIVNLGHFVQKM